LIVQLAWRVILKENIFEEIFGGLVANHYQKLFYYLPFLDFLLKNFGLF